MTHSRKIFNIVNIFRMVTKQITKICLRHLPPDMTSEELLQLIGPLPPHNYYKFHGGDITLFPMNMTRAYISFPNFEHVIEFQAKFDGQIFESKTGTEYICQVEASPSQFTPSVNPKEDSKYINTLEDDPIYLKFLQKYSEEPAAVEQVNVSVPAGTGTYEIYVSRTLCRTI